jgi:hypothetical protein
MATQATRMLRQQHRHIEQELALLESHRGDRERDLAAVLVELTAHLAAEADVFYTAAEHALGHPLDEQRRQHRRVGDAVARAGAAGDARSFARRLFDLAEAFKAHTRAEERAVHPSLEGLMSERQLEVLGAKMAATHTTVAAALREQRGLQR